MSLLTFAVLFQHALFCHAHSGTWDGQIIMNENGAPLPDLRGAWNDNGDHIESQLVLQFMQPLYSVAVPPNSTYSVRHGLDEDQPLLGICTLQAHYDYDTRQRKDLLLKCSSFHASWVAPTEGRVLSASEVSFSKAHHWSRSTAGTLAVGRKTASKVSKVHVVFMNHYDVGYTDFINGVDNTYMHKYFKLAEDTSKKMRENHSSFFYTTHPWLMDRYLNCPCPDSTCLATSLNNSFERPLQCPSQAEIDSFTAAAKRGDIAWNGVPFNIQPENMSPELFQAGFDMVRRMDARFGRNPTRTMTIRDVMYVTKAVLPHLHRNGITGLTIGSNGADYPPQLPKLHRWVDPVSKADTVVAYHPYGYGGYGLKDCAESPNGVALCTEFRVDNTGPPSSVAEVQRVLDKVRGEYPGAVVVSSTFDAFFEEVLPVKDQLPVVDLEVADTWTYGNPSDPLKFAQHRAIQRALITCISNGKCSLSEPAIQNMSFFLLKAPEHTWGTPGISGWGAGGDMNTSAFRKNLTNEAFMRAAASWAEQRVFNELAVQALEHGNHPLAVDVRKELAIIENVSPPDLSGLTSIPILSKVTTKEGFQIGFGQDGAIISLKNADGVDWASSSASLGSFVYQTFNDTEWKPFTYSYCNDHKMQAGFCKPGSNNFSESALWRPSLKQLFVSGSITSADFVVAVMEMPIKAATVYGAPKEVYLKVSHTPGKTGSNLDLTFMTVRKMPTMIGESTMVTFQPLPTLLPVNGGSAWRLDKLGQPIDPEGVQDGGNQFTHGVWSGATVATTAGRLSIEPLDSANMNPMTAEYPIGNPLPASYKESDAKAGTGLKRLPASSVRGMAANLHNNLWNTNYALYYPYFDARYCSSPLSCRNSNALFRFQLRFEPTSTATSFVI